MCMDQNRSVYHGDGDHELLEGQPIMCSLVIEDVLACAYTCQRYLRMVYAPHRKIIPKLTPTTQADGAVNIEQPTPQDGVMTFSQTK